MATTRPHIKHTMSLSCDGWPDIQKPSWADISKYVRSLNGKDHSDLLLDAANECFLLVAGGDGGRVVVGIQMTGHEGLWTLANGELYPAKDTIIHIQYTETDVPEAMCVPMETAVQATEHFFNHRDRCPQLTRLAQ